MKEWSPIWIISGYLKITVGENLYSLAQPFQLCLAQIAAAGDKGQQVEPSLSLPLRSIGSICPLWVLLRPTSERGEDPTLRCHAQPKAAA